MHLGSEGSARGRRGSVVLGGVEWEERAGGDEGEASLERQARVARSTAQMAAMRPQRHGGVSALQALLGGQRAR